MSEPPLTICVLTYGDHADLVRRCLDSIHQHCDRARYRLVVGGNAVGGASRDYLQRLAAEGAIDRLILNPENVNKCPMMRRMFEGVETEFIWWFDDDSRVTEAGALDDWLARARAAAPDTVMWGHVYFIGDGRQLRVGEDPVAFVRRADWFRGLAPPSWSPGGKGVSDYEGRHGGDGRWFFVTGGCWLIRTWAVRILDWPDRRLIKGPDDVILGEAVRQQGWRFEDVGEPGVVINDAPSRGLEGAIGG